MAMSMDREAELQDKLNVLNESAMRLTDWERSFVFGDGTEENPGLIKRFEALGAGMFVSQKMWQIIDRMYDKVK